MLGDICICGNLVLDTHDRVVIDVCGEHRPFHFECFVFYFVDFQNSYRKGKVDAFLQNTVAAKDKIQ